MKRIISAVIAAVMLIAAVPVMAGWNNEEDIMALLSELNIMVGDDDGNLRLDDYVSRAEFAKIAINSSSAKNTVASGLKVSPFRDVTYNHWSAPYVKAAVSAGIVEGYVDATFRPDNTVSFEEAVTMILKVLGYTNDDFGVSWPYGQIGLANNLEITKNMDAQLGDPLTRRQVAYLVYNALNTKSNGSQSKLITTVFDCEVIEGVTIIASNNEDSSIGSDKIYTTAGTYEINDNFNRDYIGRRGDMVIKNGDDFVSFAPREQVVEEYTVSSVIGSDLILDNLSVGINSNTTAYHKSQTMTYSSLASDAESGDVLRVFKNTNGSIDYVMLIDQNTSINTDSFEKYIIYSQLAGAVILYKNGSIIQLDVADSTTCYRDNSPSTYALVKNEMAMGDILYVKRTSNGDIDYLSYEKGNMAGPVKVTSADWINSFTTNSATAFMRDGNKVNSSEIQINDIIYYSEDLNMVLAYTTKVTGVYENALPSRDAPTSVTISGKTYGIEGVEAFNALSSSGSLRYGDTITVLLGRDGDIAGVASSDTASGTAAGYVIYAGKKDFTNYDNTTYSSYYVQIVTADGVVNEYATASDYSSYVGTVCRVTISGGKASITKLTSNSVGGTVDGNAYTIGNYKFADNVKILDTVVSDLYDTALYKRIYPQRLDGINIASSSVLYCAKNSAGEISEMILKNITGDAYSYGAIVSKIQAGNMYIYTIDIDGSQMVYSTYMDMASKVGCKVVMNNNSIFGMDRLSEYSGAISKLTRTYATIGNQQYKLSDNVLVYRKTDTLMKIPLDEAINGNYTLRAYYDKSESLGGRIRIIIAE